MYVLQGDAPGAREEGTYIRKSIKYVIHSSYVPAIKHALETNLGVSPFTLFSGEVVTSQQVHSVYLDNHDLSQYHERVSRVDRAKLVRVRWYGDSLARSLVFVERKKHRDEEAKEMGKQSSKKRAELPLARVEPYLRGDWTYEGESVPSFLKKTQQLVVERGLRPLVHIEYTRTSYQNEQNPNLRITLDENLHCYRERGAWSEVVAQDGRPSGQPATMGCAVMEVKITKAPGTKVKEYYPEWLLEQLESDHVIKLKISKYNYACIHLLPSACYITPHWLDDLRAFMDTAATHETVIPILPPPQTYTQQVRGAEAKGKTRESKTYSAGTSTMSLSDVYDTRTELGSGSTLVNESGRQIPAMDFVTNTKTNGGKDKKSKWNVPVWMGNFLAKDGNDGGSKNKIGGNSIHSIVGRFTPERQQGENHTPVKIPTNRPLLRKRGVDAKALLANERNFFHWIRIAVFMAAFGLGLVVLNGEGTLVKVTAITVAIDAILIYSTFQYHARGWELSRNCNDPAVGIFYSKYGPTCVALGMLVFFTSYTIVLWVVGLGNHAMAAATVVPPTANPVFVSGP
eukprot:comp21454_c0_seq1/m.29644 comp21454_c0_seq1/g.29644  ORF comp21454_c0_seq1/g.29644 comp21454_c0_seq1/m.29644 type:complete len:570 (-) comp21454_c0_seq1:55-1764(-)